MLGGRWNVFRFLAVLFLFNLAFAGSSFAEPQPPEDVLASQGEFSDKVVVEWTEPAFTDVFWYIVYRTTDVSEQSCSKFWKTVPKEQTELDDLDVIPGVEYYYSLQTYSWGQTSRCSEVAKGWAELQAPQNVTASDGDYDDHVQVDWELPEGSLDKISHYELFRSTSNQGCVGSIEDNIDKFSTRYDDYSVVPGVNYWYSLKSIGVDAESESKCSNVDVGYASRRPNPPTNVRASDGDYTDKVVVEWDYGVPRGPDSVFSFSLYRSLEERSCDELLLDGINGSVRRFDDYDVIPGVIYYYSMLTIDGEEESVCSNVDPGFAEDETVDPPNPPRNVQASDGTFTDKIRVSWLPPRDWEVGIESFKLWRSLERESCVGPARVSGIVALRFDDFDVVPGERYYYSLVATGPGGDSECSNVDPGWRDHLPPNPPRDLQASDGEFYDKVAVSWRKPLVGGPVSNYNLYRSLVEEPCAGDLIGPGLTDLEFDDTDAEPGVIYYYSVNAEGIGGVGECSNVDAGYRAVLPPLPPRDVQASDGTYTDKVEVTWKRPLSGGPVAGFNLFRSRENLGCVGAPLVAGLRTLKFDDTTAEPGVFYYYSLNSIGQHQESICSEIDRGWRAHLPPMPPRDVSASDGTFTNKVEVTWKQPLGGGPVDGFNLFRSEQNESCDDAPIAEGLTALRYDDTSALPGVVYYYSMISYGPGGPSGCSNVDSGWRAHLRPEPPRFVRASDGEYFEKIVVTWEPPQGGGPVNYFELYRDNEQTSCTGERVGGDLRVFAYDDFEVQEKIIYFYSLISVGPGGRSDCSNVDPGYLKVMPPEQPDPPTEVQASDGTYTDKVEVTWTPPDTGGPVDSFKLYRSETEVGCSGGPIASDIRATRYDDFRAEPGVVYYYSMKSHGDGGDSICSNIDPGFRAFQPPGAPREVSASDGTFEEKVLVTWNEPDTGGPLSSYRLYRDVGSSSCTGELIAVGLTELTYDDVTAEPGVLYYYSLDAIGEGGIGDCSNVDEGFRKEQEDPPLPPNPPVEVKASDGEFPDKVVVEWQAPNGGGPVTDYTLYRSPTDDPCVVEIASKLTSLSYEDLGLEANVNFFYSVRAFGDGGESVCSNVDVGFAGGFTVESVISGKVSFQDNVPVPGALVVADGIGSTGSDSQGQYFFGGVTDGSYLLQASKTGYVITALFDNPVVVSGQDALNRDFVAVCASGYMRVGDDCVPDGEEPGVPINLSASDGEFEDYVRVTWEAGANASSYILYRSQFGNDDLGGELVRDLVALEYLDRSAVPGVSYFYTARSVNSLGESGLSNTDEGFRLAEDVEEDCDGDGVSDEQEELDGTDPCDPGSFTLHLKSPAFGNYNSFIGRVNFLELIASGTKSVDVEVTVYDINGKVISIENFEIAAQNQLDVDLNRMSNYASDTYGMVRIKWDDEEPGRDLLGRVTTYRLNDDGKTYGFSFAKELRNPTRGVTYATANTYDPQGLASLQPNWLELNNLEKDAREFRFRLFNQEGSVVQDETVEIPGRGQRDLHAGHEFDEEGVYLAEVSPLDGATDYFAGVSRYSSQDRGWASPENFNYAFHLDAKVGTGDSLYAIIGNETGVQWANTNWAEVVNVRQKDVTATLVFRNQVGEVIEETEMTFAGMSQYHFAASSFIPKGEIGSVQVTSDEPGSIILQSLFYYHDSLEDRLQSAHASIGRISGRDVQRGSFNTWIDFNSVLKVISTSESEEPVEFVMELRSEGELVSERSFTLGQSESAQYIINDFELFGVGEDSYGTVTIRTAQPGQVLADSLRLRQLNGVMDIAVPTVVQ